MADCSVTQAQQETAQAVPRRSESVGMKEKTSFIEHRWK